jgi:integrase
MKGEQRNLKFKDGRWLVDYSEKKPDGKYKRTKARFESRDAALLFLRRHRDQRQLSRLGMALPEANNVPKLVPTIDEFSEKFITSHSNGKSLRRSTERSYRAIRSALVRTFAGRQLDSISAEELDDYRAKRSEKVRTSSLNREIVFLRMLFSKALEYGYVKQSPAQGLTLTKEPQTKIHVLTGDEARRLIEAAVPHLRPLLRLLLETGARKSEALGLRWAYKGWELKDKAESILDLEGRRIMVKAALAKAHKERSIPLSSELVEIFSTMPKPTEKVFAFSTFRRSWASACKRAGLGHVNIHWLRHTAASVMLNELGIDILSVKELLGHSDLNITMRYLHKDEGNIKRAVQAMSGWLGKI